MDILKKQPGFTTIDLLAASVIVMILFTFVLANFRNANSRQAIDRAVSEVMSYIRGAQIKSTAGQQIGICSATDTQLCEVDQNCPALEVCTQSTPPNGFGIVVQECLPSGDCVFELIAFDQDNQPMADPAGVLDVYSVRGQNYISDVYYSTLTPAAGECPEPDAGQTLTGFQVGFPPPGGSSAVLVTLTPEPDPFPDVRFVTAIIRNDDTNQERCIFISKYSGLIAELQR